VSAAYFACTPGSPPGVPGGGITGMLFGVVRGAVARMPGSTPLGGLITPEPVPPDEGPTAIRLGGAICSGGVGGKGGGGPGGACVLDGGLDGCAATAPTPSAMARTTATPDTIAPLQARRRFSLSVGSVSMHRQRRNNPRVRRAPAKVSRALAHSADQRRLEHCPNPSSQLVQRERLADHLNAGRQRHVL